MIYHNKQTQSGFALLLTILMLGVVISVTLSLVQLSIQQLRLSVDNRESEIAFQAASAGAECIQRLLEVASSTFANGREINNRRCFETNIRLERLSLSGVHVQQGDSNQVRRYRARGHGVSWGNPQRCSRFEVIHVNAIAEQIIIGGNGANQRLSNIIANYPANSLTCPAGSVCRIVAVSGFNSACSATIETTPGVLKREILLQL